MKYKYNHVGIGGTFDHLHAGHKRLIDFAFHVGKKVSIGISSAELIKNKEVQRNLESYNVRKNNVEDYLREKKLLERAHLFTLSDIYGIAAEDKTLEAVVLTRETKENGLKINQKRKANNLPVVKLLTVPFLKGEDNKIIRSNRIRKGEISRMGERYLHYFTQHRYLSLPPRLRDLLRKPLGIIIAGEERFSDFTASKAFKRLERMKPILTITVGDVVTNTLKKVGLKPDVAIIDHKNKRKTLHQRNSNDVSFSNPPGSIQKKPVQKLNSLITQALLENKKGKLIIKGEEDLLALPAILLAPLGSVVIYGQVDIGIIIIDIDEKIKDKVVGIIKQFE